VTVGYDDAHVLRYLGCECMTKHARPTEALGFTTCRRYVENIRSALLTSDAATWANLEATLGKPALLLSHLASAARARTVTPFAYRWNGGTLALSRRDFRQSRAERKRAFQRRVIIDVLEARLLEQTRLPFKIGMAGNTVQTLWLGGRQIAERRRSTSMVVYSADSVDYHAASCAIMHRYVEAGEWRRPGGCPLCATQTQPYMGARNPDAHAEQQTHQRRFAAAVEKAILCLPTFAGGVGACDGTRKIAKRATKLETIEPRKRGRR
jgi:hypothetical protein